jgi:tRNA-Thr(GGU) m(6)t(6)A37 methyltransferase TsaA
MARGGALMAAGAAVRYGSCMRKRLTLAPIGVVHSPLRDKRSAPRQPAQARGVCGTIELLPDPRYTDALRDLNAWSHIWVLFWFDRNSGWRPTVLPPRSSKKRGVFATRAPHRPNPLGMSVLRLERVQGRVLHVAGLDILDGTPVLDIKPYVPYTDAIPDADSGWLQAPIDTASALRGSAAMNTAPALRGGAAPPADPGPRYRVQWSERAQEQLAWLRARSDLDLRGLIERVLADGPAPHAYRRIKRVGEGYRLGVKDFRARFSVTGEVVHVLELATGYRKRVLADAGAVATERTPLDVHRAFVARFGPRAAK